MLPSEEQIMIRDMARAFAAEKIAPFAAEWEAAAHFPADVFKEMGKLGLMGMTVPEEWGGAGLDYVTYAMALEEIAAGEFQHNTSYEITSRTGRVPANTQNERSLPHFDLKIVDSDRDFKARH